LAGAGGIFGIAGDLIRQAAVADVLAELMVDFHDGIAIEVAKGFGMVRAILSLASGAEVQPLPVAEVSAFVERAAALGAGIGVIPPAPAWRNLLRLRNRLVSIGQHRLPRLLRPCKRGDLFLERFDLSCGENGRRSIARRK